MPVRLVLTGIVALSAALAMAWVFLVPMFEGVDENQHFQFAVATYAAGGPISLRNGAPAGSPIAPSVPDPAYLEKVAGFENIQNNSDIGAPVDYGSAAYFASISRHPTRLETPQQLLDPALLRLHSTFGYYAIAAGVMAVVSLVTTNPVVMFFAVRLLSVVFLIIGLLLTYGLLRELRLSERRSLLFTFLIGVFPTTTYIASYVQPDSAAFALIAACLYCGLRWAREPVALRWPLALGLCLGSLAVVKTYYFVAVAIVVAALLASRWLHRGWAATWVQRLGGIAAAVIPSVALLAYQAYLFGNSRPVQPPDPTEFRSSAALHAALHGGVISTVEYLARQVGPTYNDIFGFGYGPLGFWGNFGWNDAFLSFGSGPLDLAVRLILAAATALLLALGVWRLLSTFRRLSVLASRGRWRTAWAIAARNPAANVYLVFTFAMVVLDVESAATAHPAGRYWIPLFPGLLMFAVIYAPAALGRRPAARAVANVVTAGLLVFTIGGAAFALSTLHSRYYKNGRDLIPVSASTLRQVSTPGEYHISTLVGPGQVLLEAPRPPGRPQIPQGKTLGIAGWAADPVTHKAATTVFVVIDGVPGPQAIYGDSSHAAVSTTGNSALNNAGFDAIVDTARLNPGVHSVSISVVGSDGSTLYAPAETFTFEVT